MAANFGQKWYSRIPDIFPLPKLIGVQLESFVWLKQEGLAALFDEISPIESYNGGMKLFFPGLIGLHNGLTIACFMWMVPI